jgi:hypothetical protein
MLSELWFDATMWWHRSSFFQWLLGLAFLILAGLVLSEVGQRHREINSNGAIAANVCLAAAGTDLKFRESLYREMGSSTSHECKHRNVSR